LGKVLPKLSNRRPNTVILDASGLRVIGEGEWKVKIHGRGRPRKWVKIHIAIDQKTQEIVAEIITESSTADCTVTDQLLNEAGNAIKKVIGDGDCAREAIKKKKAQAMIPPPRHAKLRHDGDERDKAYLEILGLGGDKHAKSLWGKLTGYSKRALVETAFSRLKRLYGDRLFSKTAERQKVESRLTCYLLNKMNWISV
jgi:Transposase DDE domain